MIEKKRRRAIGIGKKYQSNNYDVTPDGFGVDLRLNPPPVNLPCSLKTHTRNSIPIRIHFYLDRFG